MVAVRIPAQIGRVFGAQAWEQVEAAHVSDLISLLDARFPGLGERLTEPNGEMRRWINVFVDGEDIHALGGMATPLRDGAEVYIVPAVAGGRNGFQGR
ncbi:MAG: MoaD/ThiS family protein [Herpetosiphon sp.]